MQRPSLFKKKDNHPFYPEPPKVKAPPPKPEVLPELSAVAAIIATGNPNTEYTERYLKKHKAFALCCQRLVAAKLLVDIYTSYDEKLHKALINISPDSYYQLSKEEIADFATLIATITSPALTKEVCTKILSKSRDYLYNLPAIQAFKLVDPTCSWLPKVVAYVEKAGRNSSLRDLAEKFTYKNYKPGLLPLIEEVLFNKPKWLSSVSLDFMLDNPSRSITVLDTFLSDCQNRNVQKYILTDNFYNHLPSVLCSYLYFYEHLLKNYKADEINFSFRKKLIENAGFGEAAKLCDRFNAFSEEFQRKFGARRITREEILENRLLARAIASISAMELLRRKKNVPIKQDELISCLVGVLNSSRNNDPDISNDNTTSGRLLTINEIIDLNRTRLNFEVVADRKDAIRLV